MTNEELMHYGVLGMKWGVRRSSSSSGGSKAGSKKGKTDDSSDPKKTAKAESKPKKRKLSEVSDDELQRRIKRLENEKRYLELSRDNPKINKGKTFTKEYAKEAAKKVAVDTAVDIGAQVVKHFMAKFANQAIGETQRVKNEETGEWETVIKDVVYANNKKKS